jgi:hypothetical protein
MPAICQFLGITIYMYWSEHGPPHFHAFYGEYEITVTIEGGIVQGHFPKNALRAVLAWLELHQEELMHNWLLAQQDKPLNPVKPLE